MTYSYWKDREFEYAIKMVEKETNVWVEEVVDKNIYLLCKYFESQDRYSVVTNLWIIWKKTNPKLVQENPDMVTRIENALAMLSETLKSNYSVNKGDNDDYKILLPWYFEVTNAPDQPQDWVYYTDIKVKLKSNYGYFTEDNFVFNKNIISRNLICKLENNNFSFPELNKSLETSALSSTLPADQSLANGEYSKYFVRRITNDDKDKEKLWNDYGIRELNFNSYNDELVNSGNFKLENPEIIKELLVSSLNEYGLWQFELIDETGLITKLYNGNIWPTKVLKEKGIKTLIL
ncbi:hypothetical protein SDAV_002017 [Spiroplasma phoeniceum P40]|uniref:Uncharacterized protein n=2 Tax=Spiroplasma phoeniceum TaxID=47835 RepID=A0A345DRW1_9MOLU|nr:hypothetical protein SDAV_002017 [Spiroplasma phoeniceum P40]